MRIHTGKAFNSLKLTDYLKETDVSETAFCCREFRC